MALTGVSTGIGQFYEASACPTDDGCPAGICPDIVLKRYDTTPAFRVSISDCDGSLDLTDPNLVLEVNMWAKAKLKKTIAVDDTVVLFADGIGFNQIVEGDLLLFDRVRNPEYMQVLSIDETTKEITVSRAANSTQASVWKKGSSILIYRISSGSASIETVLGDIIDETGHTVKNQLLETNLLYQWDGNDTLLPGCFWLEFKLLKINPETSKIFENFKNVMEYVSGSEPLLLTPEIVIIDDEFIYPNCSFILNPVSSIYDYFTILDDDESDLIKIVPPNDEEGVITITPSINEDDSISVIPVFDEGESNSNIPVFDDDDQIVSSIQPGMTLVTTGEIHYDGYTVAEFTAGNYTTSMRIDFNSRATKEIVESVLQKVSFVNISSSPSIWIRNFTYQMISGDSTGSDLVRFYLGINSLPSVQNLEGIDWIRRFPNSSEGFLVKIFDTSSKE